MRTRNPIAFFLLGLACGWLAPTAPAATPAVDFDATFAQVPALYNDRHYLKLEQTLASLARIDPKRTIEAVKSLEPDAQRRAAIVVFWAWARHDLAAAFAWAKDNNPRLMQRVEFAFACAASGNLALMDEVLVALGAVRGPNSQAELARTGPSQHGQFIRFMVTEWARADPAAVLDWARGLTARGFAEDIQWNAIAGVVRVLAEQSPSETFEWLSNGIFVNPQHDPAGNGPRLLFQSFAEGVIQGSGVEALEAYFRKRPGKPEYYLAYQPLTRALAKTAPERIEQWVMAIADPSFQRGAAWNGIDGLKDTRPDLAADLFLKYNFDPKPPRSLANLRAIVVTWATKEPAAALAFVQNAPNLTPEHRATLKAAIEPKP